MIFSVASSGSVSLLHTLSSNDVGASVSERFGSSLASIGDLNADGADDIIVGAP